MFKGVARWFTKIFNAELEATEANLRSHVTSEFNQFRMQFAGATKTATTAENTNVPRFIGDLKWQNGLPAFHAGQS